MPHDNEALGTIEHDGNYYVARLMRFVEHDQATVWDMLTNPDRIVEWLAPGSIELKKGGAAKLNFVDSGIVIDSTVTEFDPPRLLEYSWSEPGDPERPIRFETAVEDGGTVVTLTVRIPDDEVVERSCAGWEAHLMMLLAALEGVPIKFPFERFKSSQDAYRDMMAA